MKRLLVSLLFLAATALAQTPLDGTWVANLDTAQLSKKPHVYLLDKGMYSCSSCVPKINVKADGQDQKVSGSHYFDSVAIHVVDANTVAETDKKDGKIMGTDTSTVSADGKTLTDKFEDDSEAKPVTGEETFSRLSDGPAGSHAISGSWQAEKVSNVSSNGVTLTYQSTPDGLKMSDNNGQSYDAKFDGKDYPATGTLWPPGWTCVIAKNGANGFDVTWKKDGKDMYKSTLAASASGRVLTETGSAAGVNEKVTIVYDKQ
jgi:hypothetical protein